jgi:hypothetical protein
MKALLEFDLDDVDDRLSHHRCVKSLDMALAIWDIQMNFRKQCQHELGESNTLDSIFEKLDDIFKKYNINCDELIV